MADFGKFTGTAAWRRAGRGRRSFKLENSSGTVATLRLRRALSSLGEAKARDGEWTFKRVGFLRPRVTVREAGSDTDIGVFHASLGGDGKLEMADGSSFTRSSRGFWHARRVWRDARGNEVMIVEPKSVLTSTATVTLGEAAKGAPVALLACLGYYLTVLAAEEDAGTSMMMTMG